MPISLDRIHTKQITVGVIGLGYVGYPLCLRFAEAGIDVLGFDIDEEKITAITEGQGYFQHIDQSRVEEVHRTNRFSATTDFARISECDAVILCVPTPLDSHLEPDLKYIRQTCEAIAPYLQPETLVSLESTTYPGTTEEVVLPILQKVNPWKAGEDLFLCFSPEREDPGNQQFGTKTIPKLVGADDSRSLELAIALYELAVDCVVPVSSTKVAESAKLFENIFRSVNIALVNELKVILDRMGIDVWEVIKASGTKPFGFMPFWPGPGLGGHCIPIDPFYLTWKAKEYGSNTRFIQLAGEINRSMPHWVIGKVQDCLNSYSKPLKDSRVLVLGLAYKSDVADMRESPSLELIRLLEEKGASVDYHDPYIPQIGQNREYRHIIGKQSQPITSDYDCFLFSTKHSHFNAEGILSYDVPIIDTRNFFPKHSLVTSA